MGRTGIVLTVWRKYHGFFSDITHTVGNFTWRPVCLLVPGEIRSWASTVSRRYRERMDRGKN